MRIMNAELVFSAVDLDGVQVSEPIWLAHIVNYSVQLTFSGTVDATVTLEASNDIGQNDIHMPQSTIENWSDVLTPIHVTESGSIMINVENCGYRWAALTVVHADPASVLVSARFNVKGV